MKKKAKKKPVKVDSAKFKYLFDLTGQILQMNLRLERMGAQLESDMGIDMRKDSPEILQQIADKVKEQPDMFVRMAELAAIERERNVMVSEARRLVETIKKEYNITDKEIDKKIKADSLGDCLTKDPSSSYIG